MIVQISIERLPEEGENTEELRETLDEMPFGIGSTMATFDYDPKSKNVWKYLLDLQEALYQVQRHEITKAYNYQEIQTTKDIEDNERE